MPRTLRYTYESTERKAEFGFLIEYVRDGTKVCMGEIRCVSVVYFFNDHEPFGTFDEAHCVPADCLKTQTIADWFRRKLAFEPDLYATIEALCLQDAHEVAKES